MLLIYHKSAKMSMLYTIYIEKHKLFKGVSAMGGGG